MKSDHERWPFPWFDFMVQLPWSNFLEIQSTKPSRPSLGVNWMRTKRNDYAPKNECVDLFFNICPKRALKKSLKKSSLTILLSSLVFIFSSPKKCSLKIHYHNISLPWALAIFCQSTSFASPTAKPVGPCQWTSWSLWHFLLGVNQSTPGTSSVAN